jgi:hypothetical protein
MVERKSRKEERWKDSLGLVPAQTLSEKHLWAVSDT